MIENVTEGKDSRKLNNLEAINMIFEALAQVKPKTIKYYFIKARFPNSVTKSDLTIDKNGVILGKEDWKTSQNSTF